MTMKDDLASRSPDIRWPNGITPEQAGLSAHRQLHIDAPCERVRWHLVRAVQWPDWYPNAKDVRLVDGSSELRTGSVFRWSTFSLARESRVADFEPHSRAWYGYTPGQTPSFHHAFKLKQDGDGCLATTDEAGKGAGVVEFRRADEGRMHRGHQL